jgi:hypothetical protein
MIACERENKKNLKAEKKAHTSDAIILILSAKGDIVL